MITKTHIPGGTLWRNGSAHADASLAYVRSGAWKSPPDGGRIETLNRKSRLWRVDVPDVGKCVLKETFVSREYGFARRCEIAFKLRFMRRGLRAMRLAIAAADAGVPTIVPLAFWTDFSDGPRNFFLYSWADGAPLGTLWEDGAPRPGSRSAYIAYMRKAGAAVARLHAAGLAHIDLDPTNILLPEARDGSGEVALLDADAFRDISSTSDRVRFALAMRSLHRMRVPTKTRYLADDEVFAAFLDGLCAGDPAASARCLSAINGWARHFRHPSLYLPFSLLKNAGARRRAETRSDDAPLLKISNLYTWYPVKRGVFARTVGHVKAVDGVSLEIAKGETLGLVGESGCGKSTLARTILRLEKPRSGAIEVEGRDILPLRGADLRDYRRSVQVVFQDPLASLNPRLTVQELLTEAAVVHGLVKPDERREVAAALLRDVGLSEDALDRFPQAFSGGQRQRICIARALALRPKLLICDEAVSALDLLVRAQVLNLLADLRERHGLSYLFITHDIGVVAHIADRIAVMYKGRIVEEGPAERVLTDPRHEYTKRLLASVP